MKFSILISSFNKAKYLEDSIKSCLGQEEKNFEVILFDNESTDQTNLILDQYSNKINVTKRKKFCSFAALNQIDLIINAFKVSTGSIICLLDADDFFDIKKLKELKTIFNQQKNINVVFDLPIIQKNENKIKFKLKRKIQKNIWPSIIPTSSISIRREYFEYFLNNCLFDNYELLEIDFRLNVMSRNIDKKYFISDQNLTTYRQVDDSVMSGVKKFSKKWWIKRNQAHKFMSHLYSKYDKKYDNKIDYFISKILSKSNND